MTTLDIHPATPEERKYAYAQSQQITMQTGAIGYLRGDFDSSGKSFYTTWFDEVSSRKTDEFMTEFDDVINALRFDTQYGGILNGRSNMQSYCSEQPNSKFEGNYTTEYAFRLNTQNHTYILRCIPVKGDYNFYCWCFQKQHFDRHLEQARNGIRFITPNYQEIFRIPDGDKIRIITRGGEHRDRVCRYIDDYHLEVGSSFSNNLYHICEFAEQLRDQGCQVIPLRSSLPEQCYSSLPSTGEIIVITKGESGYEPMGMWSQETTPQEGADALNEAIDVTKAQAAAMTAGSLFGWHTPAADPKNYNENGTPIQKIGKDRNGAR